MADISHEELNVYIEALRKIRRHKLITKKAQSKEIQIAPVTLYNLDFRRRLSPLIEQKIRKYINDHQELFETKVTP